MVVAVALLGCAAFLTINGHRNPMDAQRTWLAKNMNSIEGSPVKLTASQYDYASWQTDIKGNDYLWRELIPSPGPSAADLARMKLKEEQLKKEREKAKEPDIESMLAGVSITRARVGSKARIVLPEYPRGVFLGPGDKVIKDCVVLEVSPSAVKFGYFWKAEDRYVEYSIKTTN